jgi:hypothetical protein
MSTIYPSWWGISQPIWDNLTPEEDGYFQVGAQRVGCFQFTVPENSYVMVAVIQTMRTQDWTLRCWFSTVEYGSSITFQDAVVSGWQATRAKLFQICLYSGTSQIGTDPDGAVVYPFQVEPGTYFLNVQNLFNRENGGYMLLTNSTV